MLFRFSDYVRPYIFLSEICLRHLKLFEEYLLLCMSAKHMADICASYISITSHKVLQNCKIHINRQCKSPIKTYPSYCRSASLIVEWTNHFRLQIDKPYLIDEITCQTLYYRSKLCSSVRFMNFVTCSRTNSSYAVKWYFMLLFLVCGYFLYFQESWV